MILYIIMDAICLLGIDGSRARELCLYKLQNALIAGPAQWGMRNHDMWLVFGMLSFVYILV